MNAHDLARQHGGCGEVINADAWCDADAVPSTAGLCDSPAKHREHSPPAPAEPGDTDRATAHRVWNEALCNSGVPGWDRDAELAAALAAAREQGRAEGDRLRERMEALAEELDGESRAAVERAAAMDRTDENVRRHTAERRHARVAAHAASAIRAALETP